MRSRTVYALIVCLACSVSIGTVLSRKKVESNILPTGKFISPTGDETEVGSFPANMTISKSGKFLIVTNTGFREQLSVIDVSTNQVVSKIPFLASGKVGPHALYFGVCAKDDGDGTETVAVSHGSDDQVGFYTLSAAGKLDLQKTIALPKLSNPLKLPYHVAGLAWSKDGSKLYAVANQSHAFNDFRGSVLMLDPATGSLVKQIQVGSFPLSILQTADGSLVVTNEGGREVTLLDQDLNSATSVNTGEQPSYESLNRVGNRAYVSNSNGDTVSELDVPNQRVTRTILVRPASLGNIPGVTPLGSSLSPDERRLYVALGDLNAVGVIDVESGKVLGYIPAGWYPTGVAVSPDGRKLFVSNAKGTQTLNPNGKPVRTWGKYDANIIEGTVSSVDLKDSTAHLSELTALVRKNNHDFTPNRGLIANPGITHVVYIVKENRTYDQIMGDAKAGNGDPSLTLFGQDVTPNQHALAARFGLFDNFYVNAEVSADGWNWSTTGQANEYTERNVPYNYSGRGRNYDFEGTNNGSPVDLDDRRDVAESAGGYLWDSVLGKGLSVRDYGMFVSFGVDTKGPDGKPIAEDNHQVKKNLVAKTCSDFREFDLSFPDSDGWVKADLKPATRQTLAYGDHHDKSRFSTWLREFKDYVAAGTLPSLSLVRLPRDHTSGTSDGLSSARAMVADNDYAVGEIVDEISHSRYWKQTAIFVVEDDAQSGFDHVDCHRSPTLVISPYLKRSVVDGSFYNTDSVLATIENLLKCKPNNQYLATARLFDVFKADSKNDEPYQAILPDTKILGEVNHRDAYRSKDSSKLISLFEEDSAPDFELNEILWRSIKGKTAALPRTPGAVWSASGTAQKVDRD